LRRFVNATRLVTQPAFVARDGSLYLAWSNSTSPFFGDPAGKSNVLFMRSDDGGSTWTEPIQVNPNVSANIHHVLPALDVGGNDGDGKEDENDVDSNNEHDHRAHRRRNVHIAYYTQHADGTIDVDMATALRGGARFSRRRLVRVTNTSSALAPTNIPLAGFATTNYDRLVAPCYSLGEYLSLKAQRSKVHVLWGDGRNPVTEPVDPLNPISGQTHPQQDVFYRAVRIADLEDDRDD
jgi:hypothetical protein